ncbi:hypothetical protein HYH02_006231 [Chlamydomonas schloesseri]|uniref:Uncharacterized protein n=1 Tax=Chlamydomonas schloesseri TaxID=2026947 RepID=A0A836B6B6_9CHLO|nr:hypothetical protein HYH02_006231 [Chlamydomonas schloesseri]|eukprot:KAG2448882.1 hypothetical protein HYH02_006231 [Chlamydomonas schloesseri]
MVGLPAGEREAKAPNNMTQEEYKEWLRAAGRRTLDKYRHQKGLAAKGAAAGASAAVPAAPPPPPAVELTTFKVFTQPAEATTGRAMLPTEMPRLGQGMASTSLGALPPSTAFSPPPPLHKTSCSSSAASGTVAAGSLPSSTSYSLAAASSFAGTSPAPDTYLLGRPEDEGPLGLDSSHHSHHGHEAVRAGSGGDQAMVDMLLAQVETLMRDKASLASENAGLRQQVEQLTELVGWLSLERGEEGAAGSGAAGEEEGRPDAGLDSPGGALYGYDSAYAFADPVEEPGLEVQQAPEARAVEGGSEGVAKGGEAGPGPSAESAGAGGAGAGGASAAAEQGPALLQGNATGCRGTAGDEADAHVPGPLGPLG